MNAIKATITLSFRGYRTGRGGNSRRVKFDRVIQMVQPHMPVIHDDPQENNESPDDLDAYESDFMNMADYDKLRESEMDYEKKKLLTNIVKRKYFNTHEPSMVTWGEKEQMKLLHEQDPEEWTVEKLSESFPVSRDAALKIIRAKWYPKNANVVTKYDKTVRENWKLFRAGKLNIDDNLKAHLEKFKNREIQLMDEKLIAEKYLKPKPVFPKPQSTLFTTIIQGYLEEKKARRNDAKTEKSVKIVEENSEQLEVTNEITKIDKSSAKDRQPSQTFNEFLKKRVAGMSTEKMTEVDRVLLDEYKRQCTEDTASKLLILSSESPVGASKDLEAIRAKTEKLKGTVEATESLPIKQKKNNDEILKTFDENSIETGIISRTITKEAVQERYPDFIKIPRNKQKMGVTYRVEDRYYDCDGEFLYRVPGMQD